MDIGTAKPTAAERAEVPHHLLDLADPTEDFSVARFQAEADGGHRRHRGPGPPGPARRRHRPLPAGGGRRARSPGSGPTCGPSSRRRPSDSRPRSAPSTGGWPTPTRWPRPASSRATAAASSGPSRSPSAAAGRSRRFGPGLDAYPPPTRFRLAGVWLPRAVVDRAHRGPLPRPSSTPGSSTRCGPCGRPGGCPAPPRQALGYRELLAHLDGTAHPRRGGRRRPSAAPGTSPAASGRGSAATPASPGWATAAKSRSTCFPPCWETGRRP